MADVFHTRAADALHYIRCFGIVGITVRGASMLSVPVEIKLTRDPKLPEGTGALWAANFPCAHRVLTDVQKFLRPYKERRHFYAVSRVLAEECIAHHALLGRIPLGLHATMASRVATSLEEIDRQLQTLIDDGGLAKINAEWRSDRLKGIKRPTRYRDFISAIRHRLIEQLAAKVLAERDNHPR